MTSTPPVIAARNLTKRYGDLVAVDGISFAIRRGECFGFLGPNGAGKTSTLKMIACISPVTGGELSVDGKNVTSDQRSIKALLGVVSQADSLDPDLSVIQNLVAHGRYFNLPKATIAARVWEALDLFQLRGKAYQRPDELSSWRRCSCGGGSSSEIEDLVPAAFEQREGNEAWPPSSSHSW